MRLMCDSEDLGSGLGAVKSAVSARSSIRALWCVKLDATDGLVLSATNLEVGIRRRVKAEVEEEGVVLVPHSLLAGVVGASGGRVSLWTDGNSLRLECGRQRSRLATENVDEFPEIFKDIEEARSVTLGGLKDMVGKVLFSAATDEARPVLGGVLVESGDAFRMVAADGFRLSIAESEAQGEEFSALVPWKAMKEVAKLDEVTFYTVSGQAVFVGDGTEIVSQLIGGQFPDYKQIIPKGREVRVRADVEAFRGALGAVLPFAGAELVRVSVGEGVKLSAQGEMGDGVAEFDAEIEGEPVEFVVNGKYLGQALGVMEAVTMDVSEPNLPILFTEEGWTHVLMPMRIYD